MHYIVACVFGAVMSIFLRYFFAWASITSNKSYQFVNWQLVID
jgi:hypothetical protein